jgi:hypothetical protein
VPDALIFLETMAGKAFFRWSMTDFRPSVLILSSGGTEAVFVA